MKTDVHRKKLGHLPICARIWDLLRRPEAGDYARHLSHQAPSSSGAALSCATARVISSTYDPNIASSVSDTMHSKYSLRRKTCAIVTLPILAPLSRHNSVDSTGGTGTKYPSLSFILNKDSPT